MDVNSKIGARIKSRRNELDLTQEQVGKIVGVTKSTIQRYENGLIKDLKMPVIQAIANSLHVNPDWIILKTDKKEVCKQNNFKNELGLSNSELKLLHTFNLLNNIGKKEAQKRIEELTLIPTYVEEKSVLMAVARNGKMTEIPDSDLINKDIESSDDSDFL